MCVSGLASGPEDVTDALRSLSAVGRARTIRGVRDAVPGSLKSAESGIQTESEILVESV